MKLTKKEIGYILDWNECAGQIADMSQEEKDLIGKLEAEGA